MKLDVDGSGGLTELSCIDDGIIREKVNQGCERSRSKGRIRLRLFNKARSNEFDLSDGEDWIWRGRPYFIPGGTDSNRLWMGFGVTMGKEYSFLACDSRPTTSNQNTPTVIW